MRTLIRVSLLFPIFSASGLAYAGAATHLVVNCTNSTIPPPGAQCFNQVLGQPFPFWVVAADATNNVATDYTGTVHISSSDPKATLPPDHTFTLADGGAVKLSFTFNSVTTSNIPSTETIIATDASNALTGTGFYFVSPAPFAAPGLNAISLTFLAGLLAVAGVASFRRRTR